MFVSILCGFLTLGAIFTIFVRRKSKSGQLTAVIIFLGVMIVLDLWVLHVLRADPAAWYRQTCGMVETRWGMRHVCL